MTNKEKKEAQKLIAKEWNRRKELINNAEFRKSCIEGANKLGITAKEWNENKVAILMIFANRFCSMETKLNNKRNDK